MLLKRIQIVLSTRNTCFIFFFSLNKDLFSFEPKRNVDYERKRIEKTCGYACAVSNGPKIDWTSNLVSILSVVLKNTFISIHTHASNKTKIVTKKHFIQFHQNTISEPEQWTIMAKEWTKEKKKKQRRRSCINELDQIFKRIMWIKKESVYKQMNLMQANETKKENHLK